MANKRIKDLTQTATTLANDDYVAIDGSSNGTRKIVKSDLVNDISSQVAGTYLDEANNLSDVASLDTSKLNLEVPDVGTAPNEVPLNGMLGDMAYQSSEGISVGTLEADGKTTLTNDSDNALVVETTNQNPMYVNVVGSAPNYLFDVRDDDTSKFRVDGSGDVSVGGTTFAAGKLRVEDNNGNHVWLKGRSSDGNASVSFRNNADSAYNGRIAVDDSTGMNFQVGGSTRATINSSGGLQLKTSGAEISLYNDLTYPGTSRAFISCDGRSGTFNYGGDLVIKLRNDDYSVSERLRITNSALVMGSGVGIDFGSVAGGTGTPTPTTGGLLNDYETGTWTPVFTPQTGSFTTMTMSASGEYTKIGNMVHVRAYIRTNGVNLSGGSGFLYISGLPYTSVAKFSGISVGYATGWTNAPAGAYVLSGSSRIALTKRLTSITGNLYDSATTDLNTSSGLQNQIVIGGCYEAA